MTSALDVETRARRSLGRSATAIYRMVARALDGRWPGGGVLLDVGCGTGNLWPFVRDRFTHYIGVDAVRYQGLPADEEFHKVELDKESEQMADGIAEEVDEKEK